MDYKPLYFTLRQPVSDENGRIVSPIPPSIRPGHTEAVSAAPLPDSGAYIRVFAWPPGWLGLAAMEFSSTA